MINTDSKIKGDIGLTQVIAQLHKSNITCSLPICEYLPFDLIAINDDCRLSRVSVKYRKLLNGALEIPVRTISSNSKGYKIKTCNLSHIDAFAIYCPDNNTNYFIPSKLLIGVKSSMILRVDTLDGKIKSSVNTNWASNFIDPSIIFDN